MYSPIRLHGVGLGYAEGQLFSQNKDKVGLL